MGLAVSICRKNVAFHDIKILCEVEIQIRDPQHVSKQKNLSATGILGMSTTITEDREVGLWLVYKSTFLLSCK